MNRLASLLFLLGACSVPPPAPDADPVPRGALAAVGIPVVQEPEAGPPNATSDPVGPDATAGVELEEHGDDGGSRGFHVDTLRAWFFRSFLRDETNDANTLGLELVSSFGLGGLDVTNISYIEFADYPRGIPGQPPGNPDPDPELDKAVGLGDLLTAFLFSRSGHDDSPHHFGLGFGAQLPTATDPTLGAEKWALGPAFDYEYTGDGFFASVVALQLWTVAGAEDRKDVNMLLIKPYVTYDLSDDWQLIYIPYGISIYWNKPADDAVYLPVGGGIQHQFEIGDVGAAASVQFFHNVLHPADGTVNDLRFMFELNFWIRETLDDTIDDDTPRRGPRPRWDRSTVFTAAATALSPARSAR